MPWSAEQALHPAWLRLRIHLLTPDPIHLLYSHDQPRLVFAQLPASAIIFLALSPRLLSFPIFHPQHTSQNFSISRHHLLVPEPPGATTPADQPKHIAGRHLDTSIASTSSAHARHNIPPSPSAIPAASATHLRCPQHPFRRRPRTIIARPWRPLLHAAKCSRPRSYTIIARPSETPPEANRRFYPRDTLSSTRLLPNPRRPLASLSNAHHYHGHAISLNRTSLGRGSSTK